MSAPASARANAVNERQPLMKSLSPSTTASLCTAFVVLGLVMAWCVADLGQRALSSDLFNMAMMKPTPKGPDFHAFAYPLTLAMVEFAFMGILFSIVYAVIVQDRLGTGQTSAMTLAPDRCWATLVVSHVCGTFWLQSLMMPSQVMSLGLFAVSRAADIPMTNLMRSKVLGLPLGKRQLQTTCLIFAAACTLFYSYAQLSGCVCIWSGNGVALSGLAFWIIYLLILGVPATNAVYTESILSQPGVHALQLLALQNLFACLLFSPILLLSHVVGWEDVGGGLQMIATQPQVFLLVLWLCAQMTASSVVCTMLIQIANSFWTIALRAVRVVLWALLMTGAYYMQGADELLSISCPHSSLYGFVMLCGVLIGTLAMYMDWKAEEEVEKSAAAPTPVSSIVGAGERALSTAGAGKATAGP
mmetsp:Transcript_109633/g.189665  ORF Transcript_109633/g.189665 Transcript_109633/m.189665 type:complete len:416 (+) Transcript_109633:95-1342(+)